MGLQVTPSAQAPTATFEVASVRRNVLGAPSSGGPTERIDVQPGGTFIATNVTPARLILYAYPSAAFRSLRNDQLIGVPDWAQRDRYDIRAKADVPREQIVRMVASLLEERFKLVVSSGELERQVYVLRPLIRIE